MIDTASVCKSYLKHDERIMSNICSLTNSDPGEVSRLIIFLCSIHDIGKISGFFQTQNTDLKYRHDVGGYILLTKESIFNQIISILGIESNRKNKKCIKVLLRASSMHHGTPKGWGSKEL